jgi:CHAT domain-containing protein
MLVQTGKEHYEAGQFSDAVQVLQQAARAYETAGNKLKQAQVLSLMSLADQKLGRWQQAEAAIVASLSLLETLPDGGERSQIRAQVLNAQGRLQLAMGKAEAARKTWQDTEALYAQAGDQVGILGSQINQAEAMQSIGLYRRAEKIFAQVEQKLHQQPESLLKVTGLHNLGNILRQEGDLDRAKTLLEQSLAVAQRLHSPQASSQALLSLANTERTLAKRAQELNNSQDAKKYTQDALAHYQNAAATATSAIARTQAQLNQLSLLIETNQSTSAQSLLPQIPEVLPTLPSSRASVYAHVNLAQSLMKMGNREWRMGNGEKAVPNPQDIAQILDRAIQQAKSLKDQRAESYAQGILGELYEKTKDWSTAKDFTQNALLIAQPLNAPDIAYQWQWQMGRILQAEAQQTTKSQEAQPEALIYYTEAFKTLNSLRSDLVALNPDVQFSFRESVEPVYRQLVDLLLRSKELSKDNLIQARNVIEALQLAELDNFFRDACAKPEKVNIDDLDQTAAVIYPIILEDRLEVILKLPGTDNLRHQTNYNLSETQVDDAVKQLRSSLRRRSTSLSQVEAESKQLYDWLIKPFEADLESAAKRDQSQIKTLVFVLDGSLRNLPMAALYDGERYLIERYAVAVTPGLQLLDPKPLAREAMSALIAGATDAPSYKKEGLGALDNVEVELEKIKEEVRRTQKLQNQEFLKQNIQNHVKSASFNIVHLATHGNFSSNPEQTFILDWDERIKVKELDNLLRISDQSGAIPIELLILSACETATGDKRAALGLAGVAIRAGARSTLATLWQVNDASTAQFMIQFYHQLNNPQLTKAEALRNAQKAFLTEYSNTDYNRPYHWAPFILVGNWF